MHVDMNITHAYTKVIHACYTFSDKAEIAGVKTEGANLTAEKRSEVVNAAPAPLKGTLATVCMCLYGCVHVYVSVRARVRVRVR
jgi:hypothetical protein